MQLLKTAVWEVKLYEIQHIGHLVVDYKVIIVLYTTISAVYLIIGASLEVMLYFIQHLSRSSSVIKRMLYIIQHISEPPTHFE